MKKYSAARFAMSVLLSWSMVMSPYADGVARIALAQDLTETETATVQDLLEVGAFVYKRSTKEIVQYTGSELELVIPATLDNAGETLVVEGVADDAFSQNSSLTKLTLAEGIKKIGTRAFAGNALTALGLPKSLETIGEAAFSANPIASLTVVRGSNLSGIGKSAFEGSNISTLDLSLAAKLQSIGESAFKESGLQSLSLPESLQTIGASAFQGNNLQKVEIPAGLSTIGTGAFYDNGQYVELVTEASITNDVSKGHFGSIVNPVSFWVKGIDANGGKQVLSPVEYKTDLTKEINANQIISLNNSVNLDPPAISGYRAQNRIAATLDQAFLAQYTKENPYSVNYERGDTRPKFSNVVDLEVQQYTAEQDYDLTAGVSASDYLGNDISDRITVSPESIDTSKLGPVSVSLRVEDESGNSTQVLRTVKVVQDPLLTETGHGWIYGDFTYVGNTVTGLSSSGVAKLAENRQIVLPEHNPYTKQVTDGVTSYDPITTVGSRAFSSRGLETIVLPSSITSIDDYAFSYNKLTAVDLPKGLERIGAYAFAENQIDSLICNEGLKQIGEGAFINNVISELNLNEGINSLGDYAFFTNKIKDVDFPESLTSIGSYAFMYNSLKEAVIPETVRSIGAYSFANNQISHTELPEGLKEIPDGMFNYNNLTELPIKEGVTKVGKYAFANNSVLEAHIPNSVVTIDDAAFQNNKTMTNASFGTDLKTIGASAFENTSLSNEKLVFPEGLTKIGEAAFRNVGGSNSLMYIKEAVLPSTLTELGPSAFEYSRLEKVNIPSSLTELQDKVFNFCNLSTIEIPNTITRIGSNAFYNNKLRNLVIPSSVESIASYAFNSNQLIALDLTQASALKRIENNAFQSNRLASLNLPDNVEYVGSQAFSSNYLTSINLGRVSNLGDHSFSLNKLTRIDIPDSLSELQDAVFANNQLDNVNIPNTITKIGDSTFSNNLLKEVDLPDALTYIGPSAFKNNRLKTIDIPDTVTAIGGSAFEQNALTSVRLSENIKSIGSGAFRYNKLTTVRIPPAVSTIESRAFANNSLTTINIPERTDSGFNIGSEAFAGNQLTDVVLPEQLKSLSASAFLNNPGSDEFKNVRGFDGKNRVRVKILNGAGGPSTLSDVTTLADASRKPGSSPEVPNSYTYIINSAVLTIQHVDNATDEKIAFDEVRVEPLNSTINIQPSSKGSYNPISSDPIQVNMNKSQTLTIRYTGNISFVANNYTIELTHNPIWNNGRTTGLQERTGRSSITTSQFYLTVNVNTTAEAPALVNPWIEIDFNKPNSGHLSPYYFGKPSLATWNQVVSDYYFVDGKLRIKLKNVNSTAATSIPFDIKLANDGNLPAYYTVDLTGMAKLYTSEGQFIAQSTNKLGLRTGGVYSSLSNSSKDVPIPEDKVVTYEGTTYATTNAADLPYVSYDYTTYVSYRKLSEGKITLTLPTYEGYDGTAEKQMTAVFDPAANPGWKLSDDGQSISYDIKNFYYSDSYEGKVAEPAALAVMLKLPGSKVNGDYLSARTNVKLTAAERRGVTANSSNFNGESTPFTEEPIFDLWGWTSGRYKTDPPKVNTTPNTQSPDSSLYFSSPGTVGSIGSFSESQAIDTNRLASWRKEKPSYYVYTYGGSQRSSSSINMSGSYNNTNVSGYFPMIVDTQEDRERELTWHSKLSYMNYSALKSLEYTFTPEARLKLSEILLPQGVEKAKATFYEGDNELFTTDIFADGYTVPDRVSESATKVVVNFDTDYHVQGLGSINVPEMRFSTKLRNPKQELFDPSQAKNTGAPNGISSTNWLTSSLSVKAGAETLNSDGTSTSHVLNREDTYFIAVMPVGSIIGSGLAVANPKEAGDYFGSNEEVAYKLSATGNFAGKTKIPNFKYIQVFPSNTEFTSASLDSAFEAMATNPKIAHVSKIVTYDGVDYDGVVITADELNIPQSSEELNFTVAEVKITTKPNIQDGTSKSFAWILTDDKAMGYKDQANTPDSAGINFLPTDFKNSSTAATRSSSSASFDVSVAKQYSTVEYVKSDKVAGDNWHLDGIKLVANEPFSYRLRLSNSTLSPVANIIGMDVLPYNGDLSIEKNTDSQQKVERGTNLSATKEDGSQISERLSLRGPVTFASEGDANNFEILYSTISTDEIKAKTSKEVLSDTSVWVTASQISDFSKVTAIKFASKANVVALEPGQTVDMIVPMQAPNFAPYVFDGRQGVNSFSSGANLDSMSESSGITVSVATPTATISVRKFGLGVKPPVNSGLERERLPLAGASFEVYKVFNPAIDSSESITKTMVVGKAADNITKQVLSGPGDVQELTTDEFGLANFSDLKWNRDYVLVEKSAPEGYYKSYPSSWLITADELKNAPDREGKGFTVFDKEIENIKIIPLTNLEPIYNTLRFYKLDANGNPLSNIRFALDAVSDASFDLTKPSQPVPLHFEAVSTSTGLVEFKNLPAVQLPQNGRGKSWVLTELNPRGLIKGIVPMEIHFKKDGENNQSSFVFDELGRIVNAQKFGGFYVAGNAFSLPPQSNNYADLKIYKLGLSSVRTESVPLNELRNVDGERLAGVELQLLDADTDEILRTVQTNSQGSVLLSDLKVNKTYKIKESKAPEGYKFSPLTDNGVITFVINKDGRLIIRTASGDQISNLGYLAIPNIPSQYKNRLDVIKTNQPEGEGNPVEGATFELFKVKQTSDGETLESVGTASSNADGVASFVGFGLQDGQPVATEFVLKEVSVPLGYAQTAADQRFSTLDDETIYTRLTMFNAKIKLHINKTDVDSQEAVAGAVFALYEGPDATGPVLNTVTTDDKGQATFSYAAFDHSKQYSVKETQAPEGYKKNPKVYLVDLPGYNNQRDIDGNITLDITNKSNTGSVMVIKKDGYDYSNLAGASFSLTDTSTVNPEPVRRGTTDANGQLLFSDLTLNKTYKLSEDTAPAGFDKAADLLITPASSVRLYRTVVDRRSSQSITLTKFGLLSPDASERVALSQVNFKLTELSAAGTPLPNVQTVTTDLQGKATLNSLVAGKRYLLEEDSSANTYKSKGILFGWQNSSWIVTTKSGATPSAPIQLTFEKNSGDAVVKTTADPVSFEIENPRVEPVKGSIQVNKSFVGGAKYENDNFKVNLYKVKADGVKTLVATKTITNKAAKFENLDFDYYADSENGYVKWKYELEETGLEKANGSFSASFSENTFTLDSTSNANHFVAVNLTNTFTPATGTISATKTWVGGPETHPASHFTLYRALPNKSAQKVADADTLELVSSAERNQSLSWENLPLADTDGNDYSYSVKETDANGTEVVPANYELSGSGLNLTNSYRSSGSPAFSVKKNLNDQAAKAAPDGKLFSFKAHFVGDTADEDARSHNFADLTATANDEGLVSFDASSWTFDQDDADHSFKVLLSEVIPDEKSGGVTYDETEYELIISVSDNWDGTLAFSYSYDGEESIPTFANSYTAAPVETELKARMSLEGRPWEERDTFKLTLVPVDAQGEPLEAAEPEELSFDLSKQVDNQGILSFAKQRFTEPGTYYFKVLQKLPEADQPLEGMRYADHSSIMKIVVEDNHQGSLLVSEQSVDNSAAEVEADRTETELFAFTNLYVPTPITAKLTARLRLKGYSAKDADVFRIRLTALDENKQPADQTQELLISAKDFKDAVAQLSFTTSEFKQVGRYYFQLEQLTPAGPEAIVGMSYDSHKCLVAVDVADDLHGFLSIASITYLNEGASEADDAAEQSTAAFTNVYTKKHKKNPLPKTADLALEFMPLMLGAAMLLVLGVASRKRKEQ